MNIKRRARGRARLRPRALHTGDVAHHLDQGSQRRGQALGLGRLAAAALEG